VLSFEEAGPRKKIFFDPAATTAAIVTCGGLSPGLNNVIRSVFLELTYRYGVRRVLGLRNGYAGLNPASGLPPIVMDAAFVDEIHDRGGTVLGTSRGPQDPRITVDFMEQERIDIVFCLGGDGTQRGAHAMHEEAQRRGLKKAIVGIPKTIDNDVPYVRSTFGYATALEKAETVLRGAHVEARSAPNGIAIVKLMGRAAGFIAAGAALASQEANFVLVPEVAFPLDGENGLLATLERRILARRHALIVVAEGAGQHLFTNQASERDASGNVKFQDIGPFLKDRITEYFASRGIPINLKYLDPSYFIRSVPANAFDRILSDQMGRHAVHAAMAGKTDLIIGSWAGSLTHVPISTVVADKKRMDVHGDLWNSVMATTGQPWW
jgi:6-phosphofructokinase 1